MHRNIIYSLDLEIGENLYTILMVSANLHCVIDKSTKGDSERLLCQTFLRSRMQITRKSTSFSRTWPRCQGKDEL